MSEHERAGARPEPPGPPERPDHRPDDDAPDGPAGPDGTPGDDEPLVGPANDAARRRVTRRLLVSGLVLGLLAALGSGLAGASGRFGFALLVLVLALTTAVAGLWATATLLYDDLKKRSPSRRRALGAFGLFVTTAVLMAVVAGVGG